MHIALEQCIRRGLTKQEAVATLQQLGVEALVTALGKCFVIRRSYDWNLKFSG